MFLSFDVGVVVDMLMLMMMFDLELYYGEFDVYKGESVG